MSHFAYFPAGISRILTFCFARQHERDCLSEQEGELRFTQ